MYVCYYVSCVCVFVLTLYLGKGVRPSKVEVGHRAAAMSPAGAPVSDHNSHGSERADNLVAHTALLCPSKHVLVQRSARRVPGAQLPQEVPVPTGPCVKAGVIRDRPGLARFHWFHAECHCAEAAQRANKCSYLHRRDGCVVIVIVVVLLPFLI